MHFFINRAQKIFKEAIDYICPYLLFKKRNSVILFIFRSLFFCDACCKQVLLEISFYTYASGA